jgi:LL-diaminopimelate aminotransferase
MPARPRPKRPAARQRVREAERLRNLPVYVFAELDRLKAEHQARGVDVIDLGMGNPDLPPPAPVVEAMRRGLSDPANHRYPVFRGLQEFREAVAAWCQRRYGVRLDPDTEVAPLVGSKEGLVHLTMSIVDPGAVTLLPQPSYPAHFRGTILAGGVPFAIPQRSGSRLFGPAAGSADGAGDDPLPDLDAVPARVLKKARLLILSYPTNPTAWCAPVALFEKALAVARRHRLVLVHDFAYAEIGFDGYRPPALLALPGAKDTAVEFHSFSKTFSMAGWRLGFATGNASILAALMKFKSNCDYGVFQAAQQAGVAALKLGDDHLEATRDTYRRRRDLVVEGLNRLGWSLRRPRATMYLWVPAPRRWTGGRFATALLEKAGVVVAPGDAFGEGGRRAVRIALVDHEERLREALRRIEAAGITFGS